MEETATSTTSSLCNSHETFEKDELFFLEENIDRNNEDPFFLLNVGLVKQLHDKWTQLFPNIKPFYAVKCNPARAIVETLATLGTGFDCATKGEIQLALECGIQPTRIIYANPCKPPSHIRFARDVGVTMMTFDSINELRKIADNFPEAELVLRIAVDDSKSITRLNLKFGAPLQIVELLFQEAKSLRLNIIGICFHVGFGCLDVKQYSNAVKNSRQMFDIAARYDFHLTLLDIGGGFPGKDSDVVSLKKVAEEIDASIAANFDKEEFPDLEIIAEPGTYFSMTPFSLAVGIVYKRESILKEGTSKQMMYYLNDGVYGSFGGWGFDRESILHPVPLSRDGRLLKPCDGRNGVVYPSLLWGPTLDSTDCITNVAPLPELEIGDWLLFRNIGAYSLAAASTFNGIPRTEVICYNSPQV